MTKEKRRTPQSSTSGRTEPGSSKRNPEDEFLPPLKPRPVLYVLLWIIFALWLAALVVMRLTTVHRTPAPPPQSFPPTQSVPT